jgi:hypothetical protein
MMPWPSVGQAGAAVDGMRTVSMPKPAILELTNARAKISQKDNRIPTTLDAVTRAKRYQPRSEREGRSHMSELKERGRAEAEAHLITESSEAELREYIHRDLMERWLSGVVRSLNRLEQRPATRDLAHCTLRRLGFAVSG